MDFAEYFDFTYIEGIYFIISYLEVGIQYRFTFLLCFTVYVKSRGRFWSGAGDCSFNYIEAFIFYNFSFSNI
jgi:hypothetical protein